jgi:hypothetical protein
MSRKANPEHARARLIETLRHLRDVSIRKAQAFLDAGDLRAAYTFLEKAIMYDDQATAKAREASTDTRA